MCVLPIVQHQYQMNRLHVDTVNTNGMDSKQRYEVHPVFEMYYWRQRVCQQCRYKVVWVENLQYRMKGIHPNMLTLSIQGGLSSDTGSSCIRNVLLKTERNIKERSLTLSILKTERNIKERSSGMKVCWQCRYRFIRYSKCSTQNREKC